MFVLDTCPLNSDYKKVIICSEKNFPSEFSRLRISGERFLFIIDYEMRNFILCPVEECASNGIFYSIHGESNSLFSGGKIESIKEIYPPDYREYVAAFDKVMSNIVSGNTYLLNLTFRSEIYSAYSLSDVFASATAPYKLLFGDEFAVFSPEIFIKVIGKEIKTFPMKGTISSEHSDSLDLLLNDEKEMAEHLTVVDLLRNDMGIICETVSVERYRYAEKIFFNEGGIYQTSSEIKGILNDEFFNDYGKLLLKLLPAGSVTGAPKKETIAIIKDAENYNRGFYTGVFGICEGDYLDSCVMIRFIEKEKNKLYFKSGGGITVYSNPEKEYEELIRKISIPVHRDCQN